MSNLIPRTTHRHTQFDPFYLVVLSNTYSIFIFSMKI